MLYQASFNFDQNEPGNAEETGSFAILLEASDPEQAATACKTYLTKFLKKKTGAFGGKTLFYLEDLFEVVLPLPAPALISYRCHLAANFMEIGNPVLDGPKNVQTFAWGDPDAPDQRDPFLESVDGVVTDPDAAVKSPSGKGKTAAAKDAPAQAPAASKTRADAKAKLAESAPAKAPKPTKPAAKPTKPAAKPTKPAAKPTKSTKKK